MDKRCGQEARHTTWRSGQEKVERVGERTFMPVGIYMANTT